MCIYVSCKATGLCWVCVECALPPQRHVPVLVAKVRGVTLDGAQLFSVAAKGLGGKLKLRKRTETGAEGWEVGRRAGWATTAHESTVNETNPKQQLPHPTPESHPGATHHWLLAYKPSKKKNKTTNLAVLTMNRLLINYWLGIQSIKFNQSQWLEHLMSGTARLSTLFVRAGSLHIGAEGSSTVADALRTPSARLGG